MLQAVTLQREHARGAAIPHRLHDARVSRLVERAAAIAAAIIGQNGSAIGLAEDNTQGHHRGGAIRVADSGEQSSQALQHFAVRSGTRPPVVTLDDDDGHGKRWFMP